jgi:hypothetical protein
MLPLRRALLPALIAAAALTAGGESSAADVARGQSLYEDRCGGCHEQSVHGRAKRVAGDFEAVRGWVRRWNGTLALRWSDEDIENVTVWLNATYYHHPCPPTACKVLSLASRGAYR